jgi:anti-sigma regulatory factor (Ser/Thr protein kinase)
LRDLSLHILDVVENSIEAGATRIEITVHEDLKKNRLLLRIKDNGCGLEEDSLSKVLDPFYTTRQTRRVGLGLPLLAQAVKDTGGTISVKSKKGKGTMVTANFKYDHIDRKPLGNIIDTIINLVAGRGVDVDFVYIHRKDRMSFKFDTREIKKHLQDVSINNPEILKFLRDQLETGLEEIFS